MLDLILDLVDVSTRRASICVGKSELCFKEGGNTLDKWNQRRGDRSNKNGEQ